MDRNGFCIRTVMPDAPPITEEVVPLPGFDNPFSAISHLFGAVIFAFLAYPLLRRGRGERWRFGLLGVYSFSCILLFSLSGVYHMMPRDGSARSVLGRLDHCAIFILIAGTFTPAHGLLFRGWWRWGPLVIIWIAAILGVCLKSIFYDDVSEWFGLTLYLAMGWFGAVAGIALAWRYGFRFIAPLLWGGIAYSIGGVLEFLRWSVVIPGVIHPHELFHIAVLAGALLHWAWIWQFASAHSVYCQPPSAS